jgi:hypothetical protein
MSLGFLRKKLPCWLDGLDCFCRGGKLAAWLKLRKIEEVVFLTWYTPASAVEAFSSDKEVKHTLFYDLIYTPTV